MNFKIKVKLNQKQWQKLSDITSDIAQVALASVVFPSLFDRLEPLFVVLGTAVSFVYWILSMAILKKNGRK